MSCVDEETDEDRITGRFSWSLACLQDLENGNESADQSSVKPVEEDDSEKETRRELINPSSTVVSNE